ncbi:MAG: InlB B-repeat-containing protein, partial [Clostridia bacterium]|nr:InlB B-repeat-containing protein [Clostridia bacterium]
MKPLNKYLFLLILLLLALSVLAGCSMVSVDGEQTDEAASDEAAIVSAEGFTVNGTSLSLTVPNATASLAFAEKITVSEGATWKITANGSSKNKTVDLSTGDNTFSIVVTSESRANTVTYTVTVRRRPLYTVTFDTDGGSTVASAQVEEDAAIPSPADPTKRGYEFAGWDRDLSTPVESNLTVTAGWTVIRYNIRYELNGGTNAQGNPATYTVEDAIALQAPTKGDREFLGWSDGGVIPVGSTGDKTFTANWMTDTDAYYTVEHYLENKAGTGYDKVSNATEKKAGQIGSHVTADGKSFEHYAYAPGKSIA